MQPRHWYRFPLAGRPRFWVTDRKHLKTALNLFNPSRPLPMLLKRAASIGPARLYLKQERDAERLKDLNRIQEIVADAMRLPEADMAVSLGTPGHHQKTTIQISQAGTPLAYGKLSSRPETHRLLTRESAALNDPRIRQLNSACIPEIIGQSQSDGHALIVQSCPKSRLHRKSPALEASELGFLLELCNVARASTPVDAIIESFGINRLAAGNPSGQTACIMRDAAEFIREKLASEEATTGIAHGDFAPWNMAYTPDGRLYVFDWEYCSEHAPAFTDICHRIYMPARLVKQLPPAAALGELIEQLSTNAKSEHVECWRIEPEKREAYIALYLLGQACREAADDAPPPAHTIETLRLLLCINRFRDHRLRVLVSAYACEPHKGSEPGVGWNWSQQIAEDHETWVLTRPNNRSAIEAAWSPVRQPQLHFEYLDPPRSLTFWKKGGRGIHLYYYLWQFAALRRARAMHRQIRFDIGHHVTFVNDWVWTFLSLMGIPYIWGPIGSNGHLPNQLLPDSRSRIHHMLRRWMQTSLRWLDPLFWLSARRAGAIITTTTEVSRQTPLSWYFARKGVIEPAIAVETPSKPHASEQHRTEDVHILFAGQFLSIKGTHLAIKAFEHLNRQLPRSRLILVGRGPYEASLRALIGECGLADAVEFRGWLSREAALAEMGAADIFLYPSLESAGMVVLEAMTSGLPVVALAFGGPGQMVTSDTGRLAPVGDEASTVAGLSQALLELAKDPKLRKQLGLAGQQRVIEQFGWAHKRRLVARLYKGCLLGINRSRNQIQNPR